MKGDEKTMEKQKNSGLSIAAFILSIIGCSSLIGLILAIIDLAKGKYDDKRHVLSKVSIGIVIVYFLIGAALTMLGIRGNGAALSSAQPIKMVDYGFYVNPPSLYSDSVYVEFCGIIHNPNENLIAEFPTIIVTVKNPDGSILATEKQAGSIIMPGDTITLCGMFSMPIADVDDNTQILFNAECDDFTKESKLHKAVRTSELPVTNVSERNGSSENFITGEVTNNSSIDVDMVNVSLVLRKNGKIVFMENTFVDNLRAGRTQAFEFQRYERWPDHDQIECSAMPWL